MSNIKKYILNKETLLYEIEKVSLKSRFLRTIILIIASLLLSVFYLWVFTSVLGLELPKTIILKQQNANWKTKFELLNSKIDTYKDVLKGLEIRDNQVYRNIFGIAEISADKRGGLSYGFDKYMALNHAGASFLLNNTIYKQDVLTNQIYIQSKSFDDIYKLSKNAGDMASSIPRIAPLLTDASKYRLTSPFGYRADPINGTTKFHSGFDFACKPGNPVYVTGDGVVESVSFDIFGYGNCIVVNHGFGYKTRYAHLKNVYVSESMKLKRGQCIGETGNTGRTTGPHLHYEVLYKGGFINPENYFDLDMPKEEYAALVNRVEKDENNKIIKPHTRIRVK